MPKSGKPVETNDLGALRVLVFEFTERVVKSKKCLRIAGKFVRDRNVGVKFNAFHPAAAFESESMSRRINNDFTNRAGRRSEEVRSALPAAFAAAREIHPCFVNNRRGLQCESRWKVTKACRRQRPQFVVELRKHDLITEARCDGRLRAMIRQMTSPANRAYRSPGRAERNLSLPSMTIHVV